MTCFDLIGLEKQTLEQRFAEEKYRSKNLEMKFDQGNLLVH